MRYFRYLIYATIIVAFVFTGLNYIIVQRSFAVKTKEKIKNHALILNNRIDSSIVYIENFVNFIAYRISEKDTIDSKTVSTILKSLKPKVDDKKYDIFTWTLFDFVDPQGKVLAASNPGVLNEKIIIKPEQRSWMRDSRLEPWKFHISKSDIGIVSGEPIIPMGFGISSKNGKFLGILSLGINTNKLRNVLEADLNSISTNFVILNSDNSIVVASENFDQKNLESFAKDLTDGLYSSGFSNKNRFLRIGGRDFYYSTITHYPNLAIITGINHQISQTQFWAQVMPSISNTLYLTIFFLLLLYFFRTKLLKPVISLSKAANEISKGNTKITIPQSEIGEISDLANSVEMVRQFAEEQDRERNLAMEANHNKSEFLASTSHELKNLIVGVIGLAEIVKSSFKRENKKFSDEEFSQNQSFLNDIIKLGEELMEFVNDILDLNQAQTGNFKIEEKPWVDVSEVILSSVKLLKIRAIKSQKQIITDFYKHENQSFLVNNLDPRRLKQIMVNLISNSIKYAADNTTIEVEMQALSGPSSEAMHSSIVNIIKHNPEIDEKRKQHLISVIQNRPKVLISVKDCGKGMSEEELKIAMKKYGCLNKKKDEFIDSTGLGLPLVKHLVEMQGGMMNIISKKGEGTTVTIFL